MKKIEKQALVPYSAEQMFRLVDDIEAYAEFLPWCSQSRVVERGSDSVQGELTIQYHALNQSFVTQNRNTPYQKIEMQLVEGPFRHLSGVWQFVPLGDAGCKVELLLQFEFESRLLDMTVGAVFGKLANSLVDAFSQRAKEIYA